ncbi:glycosyltransferase [Desulfarculus baarsii]
MSLGGQPRILHVSNSLLTGGLETFISDMVSHGQDVGVHPVVATLEHKGRIFHEIKAAGVPVRCLNKQPGLDLSIVGNLFNLVRIHKINLIHAHNIGAGFYAGLAGLLSRTPVIMTRHSLSVRDGASGRMLRKLTGRLCTASVCVSSEIFDQALHEDKCPRNKLNLIMNGVDLSRFNGDRHRSRQARLLLGLAETDSVVMTVGRLSEVKNQALMIRAIGRLSNDRPALKLVLIGDGPERANLETLTRTLGLNDRVLFAGERPDVEQLLPAADCFALSSDSEGAPKALLEAMACGLPIVCTAVGGIPQIISHGQCGLLSPGGDEAAMASCLAQVLDDALLASELGRHALEQARRRFSLQEMLRQYAQVYSLAVARS